MIASLRSGYRFAYRPRGLRQGPGSNTSICRATAYRPIAVANRTMVGDRSWPSATVDWTLGPRSPRRGGHRPFAGAKLARLKVCNWAVSRPPICAIELRIL